MAENSKPTSTLMARAVIDTDQTAARMRSILPEQGSGMMPGETFNMMERRFSTAQAEFVAGAAGPTIRQWGRAYEFINWSTQPKDKRNAGYGWSLIDLLMLRLMVIMVEKGIQPGDAAWRIGANGAPKEIGLGTVMYFAALISDPNADSLLAFHAGPTIKHPTDLVSFHILDPKQTVGDLFQHLFESARRWEFTLVNLRDIIKRVESCLGVSMFAVDAETVQ